MRIEFSEYEDIEILEALKPFIDAVIEARKNQIQRNNGAEGALPDPFATVAPAPAPAPSEPQIPPVPAPSEPQIPPALTPPITNVERDATGLSWDGRIHSSSKAKNKDGSWKRRRGVDDNEYQRVVAELGVASVPQPSAAPEPQVYNGAASVPPAPPAPPATNQSAPVPPAPPAPPAAIGRSDAQPNNAAAVGFGAPAENGLQWADVIQRVMVGKMNETVTQDQLDQSALRLGVTGGFLNLVSRPDLYGSFLIDTQL